MIEKSTEILIASTTVDTSYRFDLCATRPMSRCWPKTLCEGICQSASILSVSSKPLLMVFFIISISIKWTSKSKKHGWVTYGNKFRPKHVILAGIRILLLCTWIHEYWLFYILFSDSCTGFLLIAFGLSRHIFEGLRKLIVQLKIIYIYIYSYGIEPGRCDRIYT